jgi:hypothetical protein
VIKWDGAGAARSEAAVERDRPVWGAGCSGGRMRDPGAGAEARAGAKGAGGSVEAVSTVAKGHSHSARGGPCGGTREWVFAAHGVIPRDEFRTLFVRRRSQTACSETSLARGNR